MHSISPQKAQSAMEYLMTYGWAILLIAIVLAALFSLGVFSSSSLIGTTCIADSGFLCSSPVIQGTTFIATIGQSTGVQLNNAIVCFVPTSVPNPSSCSGYSSADVGTLSTGQTSTVSLLITSSSSVQDGHLWMQYGESSYSDLMSEIATVTMKGLTPSSTTALSSISYYVPIQITNTQGTATPAPFQQMITIPESTYSNYISYNGVSANFEYVTSTGTVLPAWIESNNSGSIVTWVKLPNGIPANSHTTIYLEFAPKTTNLLSSSGTSGIGEAPQLSSTYAEYDDGASVFTNYWNFAGTTLPSGWSGVETYTIDNGLTISGSATGYVYTNTDYSLTNVVLDFYADFSTVTSSGRNSAGFINPSLTATEATAWNQQGTTDGTSPITYDGSASTYGTAITAGQYVYSVYNPSTSTASFWYSYANEQTLTSDIYSTSMPIGFIDSGTGQPSFTVQWARVRAYPPSGVMPSVTFGAVQSASASLSISPNPATYGKNITITATCPVSTDTCAIDYPSLGTMLATGTGSATYTYNAFALGAGTYSSFYAVDGTQGTNSSPVTLTVNKNSTYTFTLTSCGAQVYPYSCNTTAKIATHSNQLSASLYLNSKLLGNTTTAISNTITNQIGLYTYVFNTTGNTNYTAQSKTANFSSYVPINIYYANATSSEIHKTLNTSGLYLIPKCTNNAASLSSGYCIGNMVYSTSTTLSGNIYVYGNITIDSGVTITENGHYLYATGTFDNLGTITGGSNPNAPGGAGGGAGATGLNGTSITSSYAGSAGGAGGGGVGGAGGVGGSTLAVGGAGGAGDNPGAAGAAGSTPAAPTISQSLSESMFANITKYLSSASGGGGGGGTGSGGAGGVGGTGVFGVAIGGNKVIAGIINTDGNAGGSGANGVPSAGGGGGGGGGSGSGAILIIYNMSYTAGTYSDTGGSGGAGGTGSSDPNGGAGGTGGNGQVITYSIPSLHPPQTNYYYPLKYNASTTSNAINFNVSITDLVTGSKHYQSSNKSISYLPSSVNGYLLSFKEQQGTAKVYLNTTFALNMTDINSAFNFSSLLQYFPILAHTPTWTVKPSSWEIIPANEPISDQQLNTSSGAVFSSPNLAVSFANAIKLNYPFTSFYLNLTDNPKVQTSITLKPFKFTLANSIITSLSNIANFSLFSQYTFNGIAGVNATMKLLGTFNAYSFNTIISNNTDTNGYYYLQIPKSNYTNPNITLTINASYTKTSPAYYTQTDLYCPLTASPGTAGMFYTGLVDSNGTKYTFYVSSASGSTLSGDLMQVIEQSGVKTIQVQSLMLPNTTPFTVPLEAAGESYAFDITNQPCTTYYYKGGLSVPSNPIYIFVNKLTGAYVYNVTKVFGACKITNFTQSSFPVLCVGGDPTSLTYKWKLQVFRVTSAIGTEVPIYNKTVLGSTLDLNFTLPKINTTTNTTNTYVYALFAYTDKSSDPVVGVNGGQLNFEKIIASASMWGFLALILGMILIFVGVVSGKPIIILGLANILLWVVGFFTPIVVPYYVIIASLILSAIGVYWVRKKG